ncbi:DUF4262 domain-containing protein [Bryobacter aggregatus]|uniref:DUF4262 domain-containing protein n=1 Tax=Bryobacter aggregatus TaxID=360054 RepID=UPI001EE2D986|nr:DUF4262 domain-containing protein [Bryobacter aggregatus]
MITGECSSPQWSYTVGAHDTSGGPEILTIGLDFDTAKFALNEAVQRIREGVNLRVGRHRDIVGEVECEFRPVTPKWVRHLMHSVTWYYEERDVPVLQAVYPDAKNRFPEDPEFDSYFEQPLLQEELPESEMTRSLWEFHAREAILKEWLFPVDRRKQVFLSEPVSKRDEPVTYVARDREGDWQFLGDSMTADLPPVRECFHCVVERDRSLEELADLPIGWVAERAAPGQAWGRYQREED